MAGQFYPDRDLYEALGLITLVDSLTGLLVDLEAKPEPRFWRGNSTTGLIALVDSLTGLLVNLEAKPEPRFGRGNSTTGLIYTGRIQSQGSRGA